MLLLLIRFYRYFLSPWFGHQCRFYPTCSVYAGAVIENHGVLRGLYWTCRRIVKCHPWCEGGIDPVPEPKRELWISKK